MQVYVHRTAPAVRTAQLQRSEDKHEIEHFRKLQ